MKSTKDKQELWEKCEEQLKYAFTLSKEERHIFSQGFSYGADWAQFHSMLTPEELYEVRVSLGIDDIYTKELKLWKDYKEAKAKHPWWSFWNVPTFNIEESQKRIDKDKVPKPLPEGTTKNCGVNPAPTCSRPDIVVPAMKPQPPPGYYIKEGDKERHYETPGTTVWEKFGGK
jgi:hypothetical protein